MLDTLVDLERQLIGATLQAERELPSGASFGGLHGGYARLSSSAVRLHDFTFVPGVQLSGTLPAAGGKLHTITVQITGASASHGVVVIGSGQRAVGVLDGRRFDLSTSKAHLSRAAPSPLATLAQLISLRGRLPLPLAGRPATARIAHRRLP